MSVFVAVSVSLILIQVLHVTLETRVLKQPVEISEKAGSCLPWEMRDAIIKNITDYVQATLEDIPLHVDHNCGAGLWYHVAYLNMSDSSQQCPSAWKENTTNGLRSCRRPQTSASSCLGTNYTTHREYKKVCGRAVGYQIGTPDAFGLHALNHSIDSYYVYGVSVTHGSPLSHIWTFAAGLTEEGVSYRSYNCPCSDISSQNPPSFVGNNYYCESGNPSDMHVFDKFYGNDPLWDGQQCEGSCCGNGTSPPWFSVELPNPTSDDIEVCICSAEQSYDDIALQLLEIYIQ